MISDERKWEIGRSDPEGTYKKLRVCLFDVGVDPDRVTMCGKTEVVIYYGEGSYVDGLDRSAALAMAEKAWEIIDARMGELVVV